jgi:uncharacterized protein (DUF2141 family)
MKQTIFSLLMLLAASSVVAQSRLTIVVDGIEQPSGSIYAAVYDAQNFLKKPLYGTIAKVDAEEISITLDSIAPGHYAVSLFHDENGNGKLDTGSFGIPIEKTGASNNAKGAYGPPKFEDCSFLVEEDTVIYITLTAYEMPGR